MIPPIVQPGNVFQRIRMPDVAGVAGESLEIVSVSGNLVQLKWVVSGELIDTENETRVGHFELADGSLQFITQQGINPEIVDDVILASAMQAALTTKQDAAAFLTTLVGIGGTSGSGNLARVAGPTFTGTLNAATIVASAGITASVGGISMPHGGNGYYFAGGPFIYSLASATKAITVEAAGGTGFTLDGGTADTVTIKNFANNAAGSLACANVTASGTVTANRIGVGDGTVSAPSLYGKDTAGTAGWYWVSNSCIYATSSYAVFGLRGNFITGNVSSVFCCTSGDANAGIDVSLGRSAPGVWQMGNGTNNANGSLLLTNLTASGTVRLGTYTVATLPSASANTRARAFVTDSNLAFNSTNLGSTVTAGGSTLVPVFSNGTNWVIG